MDLSHPWRTRVHWKVGKHLGGRLTGVPIAVVGKLSERNKSERNGGSIWSTARYLDPGGTKAKGKRPLSGIHK